MYHADLEIIQPITKIRSNELGLLLTRFCARLEPEYSCRYVLPWFAHNRSLQFSTYLSARDQLQHNDLQEVVHILIYHSIRWQWFSVITADPKRSYCLSLASFDN